MLTEAFESFTKKHYSKLRQRFLVSEEELKDAVQEVERLNPKPGSSYAGNNVHIEQIIPDFTVNGKGKNRVYLLKLWL